MAPSICRVTRGLQDTPRLSSVDANRRQLLNGANCVRCVRPVAVLRGYTVKSTLGYKAYLCRARDRLANPERTFTVQPALFNAHCRWMAAFVPFLACAAVNAPLRVSYDAWWTKLNQPTAEEILLKNSGVMAATTPLQFSKLVNSHRLFRWIA